MKNRTVYILVLLIILFSLFFLDNEKKTMVNPAVAPLPSATINQPETIKYDASTDLQKELDSVNPEINESDF